jgi:hypothetical protein
LLNILGKYKRFVFVTKDPKININKVICHICPCSQLCSYW